MNRATLNKRAILIAMFLGRQSKDAEFNDRLGTCIALHINFTAKTTSFNTNSEKGDFFPLKHCPATLFYLPIFGAVVGDPKDFTTMESLTVLDQYDYISDKLIFINMSTLDFFLAKTNTGSKTYHSDSWYYHLPNGKDSNNWEEIKSNLKA